MSYESQKKEAIASGVSIETYTIKKSGSIFGLTRQFARNPRTGKGDNKDIPEGTFRSLGEAKREAAEIADSLDIGWKKFSPTLWMGIIVN